MLRDTACAMQGSDARAKVETCEARESSRGWLKQRGETTQSEKGRQAEGRGVNGESEREATDTSRR